MTAHTHASGFSLTVPDDWTVQTDPQPGVALIAVEPAPGGPVAMNHVVTVDDLPAEMDFRSWQLGNDQILAGGLPGYKLIDLERFDHAGHDAVRRVAVHDAPGWPVTMLQVAVLVGGRGYTLTATVPTLDLPSRFDEIARVVESLTLTGAPA